MSLTQSRGSPRLLTARAASAAQVQRCAIPTMLTTRPTVGIVAAAVATPQHATAAAAAARRPAMVVKARRCRRCRRCRRRRSSSNFPRWRARGGLRALLLVVCRRAPAPPAHASLVLIARRLYAPALVRTPCRRLLARSDQQRKADVLGIIPLVTHPTRTRTRLGGTAL